MLTRFPDIRPHHEKAVVDTILGEGCSVRDAVARCAKRDAWPEATASAAIEYELFMQALVSMDPGEVSHCVSSALGDSLDCGPERVEQFLGEAAADLEDAVNSILQDIFEHEAPAQASGPSDAVELYTIHGSKGLTRRYVVLPGCEALWLPSRAGGADPDEQKRLFYVALTRARQEVLITHPWSRVARGKAKDPLCMGVAIGREISPFVERAGIQVERVR